MWRCLRALSRGRPRISASAKKPTHYPGLDGHRHAGVSRLALWAIPFASAVVTLALTFGPRFARRSVEAYAPELYGMILISVTGLVANALSA